MTTTTTAETLPAVREPSELDQLARLGTWLAYAESGQNTPEARGAAAALRMYYVQQLGLPPLAAAELSVIKGRVFVGAKLLRALAARAGYRIIREKSNSELCTAVLVRGGVEVGRCTFSMTQAKGAGLVRSGSAWETHPERMLWARASKYVLDDFAPEVTLGIWTDDEGDEIAGDPTVLVDEDIEWPDPVVDSYAEDPDPSEFEPAEPE